jgi:transcriptional regulator with XRE-family HTH domain
MAKARRSANKGNGDPAPERGQPAPNLGRRVKALRRQRGWTLDQLGRECGLSISALSKIENDQVSPSFDTIFKIAQAFDHSFEEFLVPPAAVRAVPGRRVTTRAGEGIPFSTANYDYEVHSAELTRKGMIPLYMRIKARTLPPVEEWSSHDGEEFVYVLSGAVELFTEFYALTPLAAGDSAYIDSTMRHAFVSVGADDARMLSICMTENLVFDDVVVGRGQSPFAAKRAPGSPAPPARRSGSRGREG